VATQENHRHERTPPGGNRDPDDGTNEKRAREENAEAMIRAWKGRWRSELAAAKTKCARTGTAPADIEPDFTEAVLDKHHGLWKHESSLLVQIRTEKIGLRAFLFQRRAQDAVTPLCRCGQSPETPTHLAIFCGELEEERAALQAAIAPRQMRTSRDLAEATRDPRTSREVVQWFLKLKRIAHFDLAVDIAKLGRRDRADRAVRVAKRKKTGKRHRDRGSWFEGNLRGGLAAPGPPESPIWG